LFGGKPKAFVRGERRPEAHGAAPSDPDGLGDGERMSAVAAGVELGFTFRARFWDVVIGFAEGAASATAGKPRVYAGGVEGVAAGEAAHLVVVVVEIVNADGACVAWLGIEVWRHSGQDRVGVIFLVDFVA